MVEQKKFLANQILARIVLTIVRIKHRVVLVDLGVRSRDGTGLVF